jgi:hypothetical protein
MRALGKAMGEFEKARIEFRREIEFAGQPKNVLNPILTPTATIQSAQETSPQPQLQTQQSSTRSKDREFLLRLAQDLNVKTEGKTDEQIWEEMRRKILPPKKEGKPEAEKIEKQTEVDRAAA